MRRRFMQSGLGLSLVLVLGFVVGCNSSSTPDSSSAGPMSRAETVVTGTMVSAAMAKATSWHMTMKSPNTDMSMDISCPDKMRTEMKSGARTIETVRMGNEMYTKMGAKWMKVPSSTQQAPVCGGGSSGMNPGAQGRVATFDPSVTMVKKGTEMLNGESCTNYEGASSKDAKGVTRTFTLCVGTDNLPRRVTAGDAVMTYSDWNKPVTIEAPKM